jgi:hypothetical protein
MPAHISIRRPQREHGNAPSVVLHHHHQSQGVLHRVAPSDRPVPEQVPERTERNLQAVGQEAGTEEPMEEGAKCEVLETEATPVS